MRKHFGKADAGTQMRRYVPVLAGCLVALGCSSVPTQRLDHWMGKPFGEPLAREQNLIPSAFVMAVPHAAKGDALHRLQTNDAVALDPGDELLQSRGMEIDDGAGYFLVRAERDDFDASYRVYQKGGRLLILYSHMGACGPAIKDALVVRSAVQIVDVYGGCSGTL